MRIEVVADHLVQPGMVVAGLVDLVALGGGDDAAESPGGLLAQPDRLEGVEPERGGVPVRLAQAQRQVHHRQFGLAGEELAGQHFLPADRCVGRGGGGHWESQWVPWSQCVTWLKFLMNRYLVRSRSNTSSGSSVSSIAATLASAWAWMLHAGQCGGDARGFGDELQGQRGQGVGVLGDEGAQCVDLGQVHQRGAASSSET